MQLKKTITTRNALAAQILGISTALISTWVAAGVPMQAAGEGAGDMSIRSGVIAENKHGVHTLYIYGPIVDEDMREFFADCFGDTSFVSGNQIRGALNGFKGETLDVRLNCPGGYVTEASVIYTALAEEVAAGTKVRMVVDGIAASAGTVIMLAAKDIRMGKMASLFIHPAWTIAKGNQHEMTAVAKELGTFDKQMRTLYAARMGGDEKAAAALMNANPDHPEGRGTWIAAADAVKMGLADGYSDDQMPPAGADSDNPPSPDADPMMAKLAEQARLRAQALVNINATQ